MTKPTNTELWKLGDAAGEALRLDAEWIHINPHVLADLIKELMEHRTVEARLEGMSYPRPELTDLDVRNLLVAALVQEAEPVVTLCREVQALRAAPKVCGGPACDEIRRLQQFDGGTVCATYKCGKPATGVRRESCYECRGSVEPACAEHEGSDW